MQSVPKDVASSERSPKVMTELSMQSMVVSGGVSISVLTSTDDERSVGDINGSSHCIQSSKAVEGYVDSILGGRLKSGRVSQAYDEFLA